MHTILKLNWNVYHSDPQLGQSKLYTCVEILNLYAEYIMQDARLDEAGIKIAKRNINNLSYAGDTTLMVESEELKSFLMKVKEESEKAGLKLNSQETKIMAASSNTSWQIMGETMETVQTLFWGVLQNHCRWWL